MNHIIDKHLSECKNTIGKDTLSPETIESLRNRLIRDVISEKTCDAERYYLGDPCSTSRELYNFRSKIIKEKDLLVSGLIKIDGWICKWTGNKTIFLIESIEVIY